MEQIVTPVMRYTRVYSCAYADLPTVGVRPESLGYATDRLTLYRWNGAAWVALTIYSASGAIGDRPTAADLPNGSIYYGTDTALLYQVQAATWATITAVDWALLDYETITSGDTTKTLTFGAHDLVKVEYQIIFTNVADGILSVELNGVTAANYSYRRIDGNAISAGGSGVDWDILDFKDLESVVGELLITGRHGAGYKSATHRGTPIDGSQLMLLNARLSGDANDLTQVRFLVTAGSMASGGFAAYGKNL